MVAFQVFAKVMAKFKIKHGFLWIFLAWNSAYILIALLNQRDDSHSAIVIFGKKWPSISIEPDPVSLKMIKTWQLSINCSF